MSISYQAYICPVCHDDHSWGPHRFTDEELAARDAAVRRALVAELEARAEPPYLARMRAQDRRAWRRGRRYALDSARDPT